MFAEPAKHARQPERVITLALEFPTATYRKANEFSAYPATGFSLKEWDPASLRRTSFRALATCPRCGSRCTT